MSEIMMNRGTLRAAVVGAVVAAGTAFGIAAPASATLYTFVAKSHPYGNQAPPPYGLRLDGIENYVTGTGGDSDTWTFDFDCATCGVTAVYDTIAETFSITGTAFGGKDNAGGSNAADGYDPPGGGFVTLDFVYQVPLSIVDLSSGFPEFQLDGFGMKTSVGAPIASGTVTFNDAIQSIAASTVVNLVGWTDPSGVLYVFKADRHRIDPLCGGGSPPDFCALPVSRGWLALAGVNGVAKTIKHTDAQDWLFVDPSVTVPEPTTLLLLGSGLLGMGIVARRRSRAA